VGLTRCRSRPAIAHRDPTAYCWRLVSGLWSSPSPALELTRRLPKPLLRARWLIAEFNTPLPLRGQHRTSPASQILLPVNDEQAPSARSWYLILSCAINRWRLGSIVRRGLGSARGASAINCEAPPGLSDSVWH